MKLLLLPAVLALLVLGAPQDASAAGCLKGAAVGGVAGHAVGHGVVGAAAGCAVGRHRANKAERNAAQAQQANAPAARR